MGSTISEKVLARAANRKTVRPSEIVYVEPEVLVCTELFVSSIYTKMLKDIGVRKICSPGKTVIVFDHRVPVPNVDFADRHKRIREFVKAQDIKHFYDVGRSGIAHHFMAEKGHARPGILYAADDIHATCLGAVGCFASSFGLGIVEALATGRFWIKIPESIKVEVTGQFQEGVMSRDLLQKILGDLGSDGALYKAVEFAGSTVEAMSVDSRLNLCSNVCYSGAKTAIINPDERTILYSTGRSDEPFDPIQSDPDAQYSEILCYDVSALQPQVAVPHDPVNTHSVKEVEGVKVHQAFIGSCAGGHLEDMRMAARIVRGKKVHSDVRLIVIPTTPEVYLAMAREGLIEVFVEAGGVIGPPNCGPCAGGHMGILAAGEVCVSSSTLNLKGRMGSPDSEIYLGSAATVAAAAVAGKLVDCRDLL
jgi:3-isopropylmalate/(R)-2-methylmalate dehydratase large subunit